jgi:hypothetical protein
MLLVIFDLLVTSLYQEKQNNMLTQTQPHMPWRFPSDEPSQEYYEHIRKQNAQKAENRILPPLASVIRSVGIPQVMPERYERLVHQSQSHMYPPPHSLISPTSVHTQVTVSCSPPQHSILENLQRRPSIYSIINESPGCMDISPSGSPVSKTRIDKPRKSNKNARVLPVEASSILMDWFEKNKHNPYPTTEQKEYFIATTGLTRKQIKDWFVNHRQRYLAKDKQMTKPKKMSKTAEKFVVATRSFSL